MGYYTSYILNVRNDVPLERQRRAAIRLADILEEDEIIKKELLVSSFPFDFISYDSMKWYDWERDMSILAEEFPDIDFVLYGEGEEWDDMWRAFFKGHNYEFQLAHIYFDPEPNFEEKNDE